jgi:hypothetical protein
MCISGAGLIGAVISWIMFFRTQGSAGDYEGAAMIQIWWLIAAVLSTLITLGFGIPALVGWL